jgi:glycosyltransferase involved in cell wall biosynthesis
MPDIPMFAEDAPHLSVFCISRPKLEPQVQRHLADVDFEAPLRRWQVTHACDVSDALLPVVQAQLEAGMRAAFLTPDSVAPAAFVAPADFVAPASSRLSRRHPAAGILQGFRDLRRWQRLLAADALAATEILHAHCFAAAMAAVLGDHPAVYDFHASVARVSDPCTLRLLRVAENFALMRAAAVVVHSRAMWAEALRRGVCTEDLFLVPDPVEPQCGTRALACADVAHAASRVQLMRRGAVVLFAPDLANEAQLTSVLQAFSNLAVEVENAELLVEADAELAAFASRQAQQLELTAVRVVGAADRLRAMKEADIVVAGASGDERPSPVAIAAFAHGRALLAADVATNREVTAQGSGCIWYRAGDARDLACRAAFLARNADFRAALAASGRAHLAATRGPAAVASFYDEVYRHAWRKRPGGPQDMIRQLQAVQAPL